MPASRTAFRTLLGGFVGLMIVGAAARPPCSEAAAPDDTGVVILRCTENVIAAEMEAVRSPALLMSAHPRTIQLDAGAIAISTGSSLPFTVLTRDATVSGLEGEWLILTGAGETRAAVWRGTITLRLRADGSERVPRAGDDALGVLEPERKERLRRALQRAKEQP